MAVFSSSGYYVYAGLFFLCLEFSVVRVSAAETCEKLDVCSCKKSNGKVISLWEIDGGSGGPSPQFKDMASVKPDFTFSWNPCTPFAEKDGCSNAILCQMYKQSDTFPIARTATSFTVNEDQTIILQYKPVSYGAATRSASITLKCDSSAKGSGTMTPFAESPLNTYSATLTSRCACDGACPQKSQGGSSSGLNVGSILLIVFFPLLLVYFIAGILFNKFHKGVESVPEMIPNHSFWGDLPFLVKDGFVFTFQGIAGCCKGLQRKLKGDSYAEI